MIGILTALELEASFISSQMERSEAGVCGALRCRHGYLNGQEVVLALCGVGKVNAAAHAQMLLDQYRIDKLILTGAAGAVAPGLQPLDLVVGRTFCYHDVPAELLKRMLPSQLFYESDTAMVETANAAIGACRIGTIATGDQFVSGEDARRSIHLNTGALCVDMESAAVAQTAWLSKVPFVAIRCISDLANSAADADFNRQCGQAAERAAQAVCQLIATL